MPRAKFSQIWRHVWSQQDELAIPYIFETLDSTVDQFESYDPCIYISDESEQKALKAAAAKEKWLRTHADELGLRNWELLKNEFSNKELLVQLEHILVSNELLFEPVTGDSRGWHFKSGRFLSVELGLELIKIPFTKENTLAQLIKLYDVGGFKFSEGTLDKLKHWAPKRLERLTVGITWIRAHFWQMAHVLDDSAFRYLGRSSEEYRWALMHGQQRSRKNEPGANDCTTTKRKELFTLSDFNWSMLKAVKSSPALRLSCLPPALQWKRLLGFACPDSVCPTFMAGFKVKTLKALAAEFEIDLATKCVRGMQQPLFNLVRMFGDKAAIQRFTASCGYMWSAKGIHDAGQFTLAQKDWTPAKWQALCLRFPDAVHYASDFPRLEKANIFPKTLNTLVYEVRKLGYPKVTPQWQPLLSFCLEESLTSAEFLEYQKFWGTAKVKTAEFLPHVKVCGSEVGVDEGWTFEKLAADDYRGPMLGLLTGCCQHLMGAGKDCAEHGVASPYSAFYIVRHNRKVIAQSWCWRTKQGAIVIDSIESRIRNEDALGPVVALYQKGIERMLNKSMGVHAVYLGLTDAGITESVSKRLNKAQAKQSKAQLLPADDCGYMDGRTHVLIARSENRGRPLSMPKVENYKARPVRKIKWTMAVNDFLVYANEDWPEQNNLPYMQAMEARYRGPEYFQLMQELHARYLR